MKSIKEHLNSLPKPSLVASVLTLTALALIIYLLIVNPTSTSLSPNPNKKIGECKDDSDCPARYTCECTRIIPACKHCEGGKCYYSCVEKQEQSLSPQETQREAEPKPEK